MSDRFSLPGPALVTGGLGFIGRHLVEALLEREQPVIVFDLPGGRVPDSWRGRVEVRFGDITQSAEVQAALADAGVIFHTAAVVSDWAPRADFESVTLEGSRYVFDAAVRSSARVLLLSSFSVYGDKIGRGLLREESGFGQPLGIYGEYKQKQEALAWDYHRQHGLPLTVVRPSKVYGPGSKPWVHEVANVLRRGQPALIDGGNYVPGLVYVDNLVDLILLAASHPQALGRAYNGYDGTTTTLRQYFTDLAQIVGAPPPRSMPRWAAGLLAAVIEPAWKLLRIQSRPLLTRDSLRLISANYQISIERAQIELGFRPRVTYAEGIRRIAEYWRDFSAAPQAR
jgi:nucleoside-diphosphate-sugar epimerase